MGDGMSRNRKIIRFGSDVDGDLEFVWEHADREVFVYKGIKYRRPDNPNPATLAGPRCVHGFRKGAGSTA